MSKKKVLIFIDWYLPGYKAGGPIRSMANLVEKLSDRVDFSIVTTNTDYNESTPYPDIEPNQWLIRSNARIFYYSKSNLNRKSIKQLIRETDFDTLYINGIFSWYFSLLPLTFRKYLKKKNVVVASRGMLSQEALSIKSFKKRPFVFLAKVLGLYNNVSFHATKPEEKKDIQREIGNKSIFIIENLSRHSSSGQKQTLKEKGGLSLFSLARISPEKNQLFALKILSKTRSITIDFNLYGSINDEGYWEECQQVINEMPEGINVNHYGAIKPNEIGDMMNKHHFLFLPTKGENYGHAIAESLIFGCPVLISDQTPWRNLVEKGVGWDLNLSEENRWIEVLSEMSSMDQEKYDTLLENITQFASQFTDTRKTEKLYMQLFSQS